MKRIQNVRLAIDNQALQTIEDLNETLEKKINLSTFKSYLKNYNCLVQSYQASPYSDVSKKVEQVLENRKDDSFGKVIELIDSQFQSEQEPNLQTLKIYEEKYSDLDNLYRSYFYKKKQLEAVFLERNEIIYIEKNNAFLRLVKGIDEELKENQELPSDELYSYKKRYKKVRTSYLELPDEQRVQKTQKVMEDRIKVINEQVIFKKEQQSDQLYISLRFNPTYDRYIALLKEIDSYEIGTYNQQKERIRKKGNTTISSAQSYIKSQISPLLDLAKANHRRYDFEADQKARGTKNKNPKFYKKKSLKLLKKAYQTLKKNNPLFLIRENIISDYNQTAKLIRPSKKPFQTSLKKVDLKGVNLKGVDLKGVSLAGANLKGVDLKGINLIRANLEGANLWGVDLKGADLWEVDLRGVNLKGANLKGVDLRWANLEGANLQGATYNNKTKFNQYFNPRRRGMIKRR